jgi:TPR repeat protein
MAIRKVMLGLFFLGMLQAFAYSKESDLSKRICAHTIFQQAENLVCLGEAFHYGDGTTKDHNQAFSLFSRAAEANSAKSFDYLGLYYAGGLAGLEPSCSKAINFFEKGMKGGYAESKKNLAWMLATCPTSNYRNGHRALQLAKESVQELGFEPATVGTLAAAYAEVGDFRQALLLQETGIQMMKDKEFPKAAIEEALVRALAFKALTPWRGSSFNDPRSFIRQNSK